MQLQHQGFQITYINQPPTENILAGNALSLSQKHLDGKNNKPYGKAHLLVYHPMVVLKLCHNTGEDTLPHLLRQFII